jgi:transposase InsO family protein
VSAEAKLELLGLIDRALVGGWAHARACRVLDLQDVRAHRWRARLRETGTLEDRDPGGGAVHGLLAWEEQAILDLIETWGWVDRLLFASALEDQGLLGPDGLPLRDDHDGPILVAWSDNGSEMKSIDTRQFMALMAIAQHHGRPGTPTDQAHVESFFSHLKGDWPHLTGITDPAALDTELARIRGEYNTVRLHAAIGYVTPDDEHHGRGPGIRRARAAGMRRARTDRIKHNRANKK